MIIWNDFNEIVVVTLKHNREFIQCISTNKQRHDYSSNGPNLRFVLVFAFVELQTDFFVEVEIKFFEVVSKPFAWHLFLFILV